MPSPGNPSPEKSSICWPGVLRTLLVEVAVLLVLSGAVVRYLNWSSDAAWAEFNAASEPAASGATSHPLSVTPDEAIQCQPLYGWEA